MAKLALSGWEGPAETGEDYPHKLSSPMPFFWTMVIFLIIVGFVGAILFRQAHAAFVSNPGLNGLILGVLLIGILLVFSHVLSLRPEVRWFNSFRAAGSAEKVGRDPVLLAPMRALIGRHHSIALSANAMPEDIAVAREAGFHDYWTKPIDFGQFLGGLDALAVQA